MQREEESENRATARRVHWDLLRQPPDHVAESAIPAAVGAEGSGDVDDSEVTEEGIRRCLVSLTVRIAAAMRRRLLRRSWFRNLVLAKSNLTLFSIQEKDQIFNHSVR